MRGFDSGSTRTMVRVRHELLKLWLVAHNALTVYRTRCSTRLIRCRWMYSTSGALICIRVVHAQGSRYAAKEGAPPGSAIHGTSHPFCAACDAILPWFTTACVASWKSSGHTKDSYGLTRKPKAMSLGPPHYSPGLRP